MKTMKAVVFKGKDRIAVEEVPKPTPRAGEAVIASRRRRSAARTSTSCAASIRSSPGSILGHEPVGVIEELGAGLDEYYASASASSSARSRRAASASIA